MLDNIKNGALSLLYNCANLHKDEKALIISDKYTQEIGENIKFVADVEGLNITHITTEAFSMHGEEPSIVIAEKMLKYNVVMGLTKMSMAHSKARFEFSNNGGRYLSLPDYSMDVLSSKALTYDFRLLTDLSVKIANLMTAGNSIRLTTNKGTDLLCNIKNRIGNAAPGWCFDKGIIASPPDSETNIAPIEEDSHGIIVVDGSIPCSQIGLLKDSVTLYIKNGKVIKVIGYCGETLTKMFNDAGPKSRIIAEIGIGLNPFAKLCGSMLEDEGCLGTAHIGIGANATIGGQNNVAFHLDHIMNNVTLYIDEHIIMKDGHLLI